MWKRIEKLLLTTLGQAPDSLLAMRAKYRQRRDEAAFSTALIALSAKMAKADGTVTADEVRAFTDFFTFPPQETKKVEMLFNMARQDVAGFDAYLFKVVKLFNHSSRSLVDVLDCLFHIALADGIAHPRELELLERAAHVFNISAASYQKIKSLHLGIAGDDPFTILGLAPDANREEARRQYHRLVKKYHPDVVTGRGVPVHLVRIAEDRMAAINNAYEKIIKNSS